MSVSRILTRLSIDNAIRTIRTLFENAYNSSPVKDSSGYSSWSGVDVTRISVRHVHELDILSAKVSESAYIRLFGVRTRMRTMIHGSRVTK